jgi:hypothetical protein
MGIFYFFIGTFALIRIVFVNRTYKLTDIFKKINANLGNKKYNISVSIVILKNEKIIVEFFLNYCVAC